ncbi:hypothetical protein OBRU01_08267 [Operophtera brumata]|uniref:Protein DPCD n=1 Tax=Operophtera brumata TaxID=104452 RepID=A0A0L7LH97_OPEBR|nr:hypothetical protein OBRU01_08267 [Operophtera brumata]
MKRSVCLIEATEDVIIFPKKVKESTSQISPTMHKNTIWYRSLVDAEKTCLKEDKLKKIHYKFDDGREMVEEYNVDTQVMCRRAWKVTGKLGGEGKWDVEPTVTRRNTRVNLEWRIRNLPYPIETYSISANDDEKCIIVRTTNKKYFKRLQVPELLRLNIPLEQTNIQASHQYNTLYKKPQQLLEMDKDWYEQLKHVKPVKDVPNDCKAQ